MSAYSYDNSRSSGKGYDEGGYYEGGNLNSDQQGYYPDANSEGLYDQQAYGGPETVSPSYYPQHETFGYSQQQGEAYAGGFSHVGTTPSAKIKDGSFYLHNEIAPQLHGFPVTSLGFDAAYEAIYTASTTQSVSSTRWRSYRASILATHNSLDGMVFSSVAGHPEASPSTLQTVYECMFGIPKTVSMPLARQHIPPHAYRAPFGSSEVETSMSIMGGQKHGHIGITTILPLDGYAATISPAAVRIHSHGGLQLHDYNIEGMMSGTIHPHSDQGGPTHISVGGIPCNPTAKHREHEVHCMDLWQGLRIVSSRSFKDRYEKKVGVTALATSHDRGSIVAGCSDGHIRVLDGSLREVATVKGHKGGISSMSISPDGMLIATTGYSSRVKGKDSSILYAFPDPTVQIYDIRCLGRAGISHPFAGVRGSAHHVAFLPDLEGLASNRLLVGSGQTGGGLQIMVPFKEQDEKSTSFFVPQLEQGESISAMTQADDNLALGTSNGRVVTYKLAGYGSKAKRLRSEAVPGQRKKKEKKHLVMPPFVPSVPPFSMDPKLLLPGVDPGIRNGTDEKVRALFTSYILQGNPKISTIGNSADDAIPGFGSLGGKPIVTSGRRKVTTTLLNETTSTEGDFVVSIPTSKLEVDILADHNPVSKRYKGKKSKEPKPNPNKFLYNSKLSSMCYDDGGKRRYRGQRTGGSSGDTLEELPQRYRLKIRPHFKSSGAFDPCEHNNTGLFPGWDYSPAMPNSFAPPVLLMLYFLPELRSAVLGAQYNEKLFSTKAYEKALSPELGFVFHQIESQSQFGMLHPVKPGSSPVKARIGAWTPSNFLTCLSTMPEAEQLQILDGSPAAVDPPRRPESFCRFLVYQLDKELSKNPDKKLLDSLQGIDFVCSNQFIMGSSPPSQSSTRAMTLDLSYDIFLKDENKEGIRFGDLLQHSLSRETRLRAWNSKSKAYETIVQRKIVTTLPQILTISCACAGRKEEDGLWIWRTDDGEPWLPEIVEVELNEDGSTTVKELKIDGENKEVWTAHEGRTKLPEAVSKLVTDASTKGRHRYRLDAVLSFINDDFEGAADDENPGHHVLHARVPLDYQKRVLMNQQEEAEREASRDPDAKKLVLTAGVKPEIFQRRAEQANTLLSSAESDDGSGWVLYNGFAVSNTVVEDARAFHVSFKEPCLIMYRTIDSDGNIDNKNPARPSTILPPQVMNARSLSAHSNRSSKSFNVDNIDEGKLVAFDAEFVSVQEEEATISESGSKLVLRETRHAVGRISIIDCKTRETIIDDHVLPKERVVDYLTRFSGIVAEDLDPAKTPHILISTRSAYLKLRYLMEQGCIFVGHGLRQDFATVNLVVPPNQILDTVEIYHQPGMRYISLRFLANYVLRRDMQQDVHDSVEDAMAAFELYENALRWKEEGAFDQKLQEIYYHGQRTDWKVGVES